MPTVTSSWKPQWLRKAGEEQLEALAFDDALGWGVVDHQVGEVGLARHRAQAGELGRGEAHAVERAGARVGHVVERRLARRGGQRALAAEMKRGGAGIVRVVHATPDAVSRRVPQAGAR